MTFPFIFLFFLVGKSLSSFFSSVLFRLGCFSCWKVSAGTKTGRSNRGMAYCPRVVRLSAFLFSAFCFSASPNQVDGTLTWGLANNLYGWNSRKTATFMYFKDKSDCPKWANALSELVWSSSRHGSRASCHEAANGHTMLHLADAPWCDSGPCSSGFFYTWYRYRECPRWRGGVLDLLVRNGLDPANHLDGQSRYGYGSLGCPYYGDRIGKDFGVLGAGK